MTNSHGACFGNPQLYYVQDTRPVDGDCALWWRPNSRGYTTDLSKAGLYTRDQILRMRDTDVGWPREYAEAPAVPHVGIGRLRENGRRTVRGRPFFCRGKTRTQ